MLALGRELQRRAHRVTLFGIPDVARQARDAGVGFAEIGRAEFPDGSVAAFTNELGGLSGTRANIRWHGNDRRLAEAMCRDGITAIGAGAADGLIVDQMDPAGSSVADALEIPFVTLCGSLAVNWEPGIPPVYTPWMQHSAGWARLRNRAAFMIAKQTLRPVRHVVDSYRRRWGLPERRLTSTYFHESRLAVIAQLCAELDFDRAMLPPWFHYVGLMRDSANAQASVPFPYSRLTGAPVVYASLGTLLQGAKPRSFEAIAKVCAGRGAQLVITLGGAAGARDALRALPGDPIVVDYAPQLDLISRSTLVITHGGLNTVLESLSYGVPLVTMPIAFDQPGVCARVKRSGAGVVVHRARLASELPEAVRTVLENERFVQSAQRLRASLAECGGVSRAAWIAERALASRAPVMRESYRDASSSAAVLDITHRIRRRAQ